MSWITTREHGGRYGHIIQDVNYDAHLWKVYEDTIASIEINTDFALLALETHMNEAIDRLIDKRTALLNE